MNEIKDCVVVIPVYKSKLNDIEYACLRNCREKLDGFSFCFIAPVDIKDGYYHRNLPPVPLKKFGNWNSNSLDDYNRLLMTADFYHQFSEYRYMLIFQLDGWLIKGGKELDQFLALDFDYIGAPWVNEGYRYCKRIIRGAGHSKIINFLQGETICKVGNGGVSLRKIKSMSRFFEIYKKEAESWDKAEDIFISFYGQKQKYRLKIPQEEIAKKFSLEKNMKEEISAGNIPLAVHKWEEYYPELLDDLGMRETRRLKEKNDYC